MREKEFDKRTVFNDVRESCGIRVKLRALHINWPVDIRSIALHRNIKKSTLKHTPISRIIKRYQISSCTLFAAVVQIAAESEEIICSWVVLATHNKNREGSLI